MLKWKDYIKLTPAYVVTNYFKHGGKEERWKHNKVMKIKVLAVYWLLIPVKFLLDYDRSRWTVGYL